MSYKFEDFLANVSVDCIDFVNSIHEMLTRDGYTHKIESKASGFFISYAHPKTKRSILNFLFRKKGLYARIYGDNCNKYEGLLNTLPASMAEQIAKAGVCKRLIDPKACNPKCVMGYDFTINHFRYQKCRNSCFYFDVNPENIPFLTELIKNENKERLI